ncbi:hypothetical protein VNO78_09462 [Psophocarpus tetragonolobus]|uniref:Response regulatory domain-containing protein n=1 Tax=Psophocarpus tetragonolobus TaxID=3891 RepID=A0AAN9SW26_PSOTE
MENTPSFARGLNLLLVDNNKSSLLCLSSMLEQYTFKVTTANEVSDGMSKICNNETQFKLVVVKLNMPGLDALAFLDLLHQKDIPAVFISSGGFKEKVIWKALAKGSCYFLEEPIARGANKGRKIDNDDNESKQREKKAEQKIGSSEKIRFVWTSELHLKFIEVVALLGGHKNIPTLTTLLNANRKQNLFETNYAKTQESNIQNLHMPLGNSYEFQTDQTNQILGSTIRNSLPYASSTVQNLPETKYWDIIGKLEEDCDTNNVGNEVKSDDVEEFSNMLRTLI